MRIMSGVVILSGALALAACRGHESAPPAAEAALTGDVFVVAADTVDAIVEASGTAQPIAEATLSTKLMGTVTAVHAREGDVVRAGQALVSIDARDLNAKDTQAAAALAEAEALYGEAELNAQRMRKLHEEDAAPRVQLDAAETGLVRARAAVNAARAGATELRALRDYATVRAPFAGVVTRRFIDAGAFVAPGTPLVTLQDAHQLRIEAAASAEAVRRLQRGMQVRGVVEGVAVVARVEGVMPAPGSLYTVNAVVDNTQYRLLPGSAASLLLPLGRRAAIVVPRAAVQPYGDLSIVTVTDGKATQRRSVRTGVVSGDDIEVVSGLRIGENVLVPAAPARTI